MRSTVLGWMVLAVTGCGPSVAYFAPADPSGLAEMTERGLSFRVPPSEREKPIRVNLRPVYAEAVSNESTQDSAIVYVEIEVVNRSEHPVQVKASEASLKADFIPTVTPRSVARRRGEADAIQPGGDDAWMLQFSLGPPEVLDRLSLLQLKLPLTQGDQTHTVSIEYRRYYPYRYAYYHDEPYPGWPYGWSVPYAGYRPWHTYYYGYRYYPWW